MDERQEKITGLLKIAATYMLPWFEGKRTGNYSVTIEVVMNDGGIRDAYFNTNVREKKTV